LVASDDVVVNGQDRLSINSYPRNLKAHRGFFKSGTRIGETERDRQTDRASQTDRQTDRQRNIKN